MTYFLHRKNKMAKAMPCTVGELQFALSWREKDSAKTSSVDTNAAKKSRVRMVQLSISFFSLTPVV